MTDTQRERLRGAARRIFARALREIDVGEAVRRNLVFEGMRLRVGEETFEFAEFTQLMVVAVGKAAAPMAEAAVEAMRTRLAFAQTLLTIVVGPIAPDWGGPVKPGERLYFSGSHPAPNANSRKAAEAVLAMLRHADGRTLVLFLVSGGASAMLEAPLDRNLGVDDVAKFYGALVQSGMAIGEINTLRKQVSAVKGGRLARAAGAAVKLSLIVSDVPHGALDMVASGPTLPDLSTSEEVRALHAKLRALRPLPASVERFFASGKWERERVRADDPAFERAAAVCILSSEHLEQAAVIAAQDEGFRVVVDNGCDDWEAKRAAHYLLERSEALAASDVGPSCVISVGEVVVKVEGKPGKGGRNQHFALECALELAGRGDDAIVLSAGSDGIDGHSEAAGALADGQTCAHAKELHMNAERKLHTFNSGKLFHSLRGQIITGPTGNNLRDLRLVIRPGR